MTVVAASPGTAHPPSTPEHGVNESTFVTLWSGDDDAANVSAELPAMASLAAGTDVPLDAPPAAVEKWNRGELADWPSTGPDRSVYPPHASLEDGTFVRDAFVEIVAVNPSTRAWLSPRRTPHYVAPDGTVLGVVDYRVELPPEDVTGSQRVSWRLVDHRIVETALVVDGRSRSAAGGTDSPALAFSSLDDGPGEGRTLELRTTIAVEIEETVRIRHQRCRRVGGQRVCQTSWEESVSATVESLVVTDDVTVTVYDLDVGGARGRYPDGDLGLVVFKDEPWLGYTLPAGEVRGVWRFFSARDARWDTVVSATEAGSTTQHSPLHPLQAHAYPFEPGPTVSPRRSVSLVEAYGSLEKPPILPAAVHLDVMTEPYLASYGLVTRVETANHDLASVTAHGLVRGVTVSPDSDRFVDVPINRSELTLSVDAVTDETVTVRASLVDVETGQPIDTRDREGYLLLDEERVETNASGMAILTVPRSGDGVTARYVPARWWVHEAGYVGISAIVDTPGHAGDGLSTLFRIGLPVSLLLLAVFIVDRFTGWRLWPPWREV